MTNLLDSAIAAARSVADDGADDGAATRLRIRESLAARGTSRKKLWTMLAATIGTLFASTAFACRPAGSRHGPHVPSPSCRRRRSPRSPLLSRRPRRELR